MPNLVVLRRPLVASLNENQSLIKVDVLPAKPRQLPRTHPGVDSRRVQREEPAAARGGRAQKARDLFLGPEVAVRALRKLGLPYARSTMDPAELLRVVEERGEQRQVIVERLGRHPALVTEEVDVLGGDLVDEQSPKRRP